jgi:cobalt-zinc-cadmium efflux system outer membrane protein
MPNGRRFIDVSLFFANVKPRFKSKAMLIGNSRQILIGVILVLGGCTQYKAMPLSSLAVQGALSAPAAGELRVEARSIQHPMLKPVELDDRAGLTPDQAAIVAVLVNPSLRAARDERGLADAQLLQAGILPNPQVNLDANYPFGTEAMLQSGVTDSTQGLSWEVTQLLARNAKIKSARSASKSVDLSIAWQEWQTALAAESAVYDLVSLQGQVQLTGQIDQQLAENLSVIREAVNRGDKTLVDLAGAESTSQDAHAVAIQAQRDLESARITLNKSLGLSPDATVKLNPNISLPDQISSPSMDKILTGLESRRLDLVALRMGYQAQEETLRAAVIQQFPRVNIGFNNSRDDTAIHLAGFAVTFDLPVFDRNQGIIAIEKATRQKLFDEYIERVFEARYDVYTAIEDLKMISGQIAAQKSALPNLQELIDTYRDAYNHRNVDVVSYYSAINTLTQKQLDMLKLRQQLTDNRIALELAAGEYLPQ